MSAYLVLMQEVHDDERYRNDYVTRVRPLLAKHGAEILVASSEAEPAEGDPPSSAVVLRFPDARAAWAFLNDPDYQPVRDIRFGLTSRGQMVVVPGFEPVA